MALYLVYDDEVTGFAPIGPIPDALPVLILLYQLIAVV
jgi:hypothetical protein